MLKNFLLFSLFIIVVKPASAQNQNKAIDSLTSALALNKEDTNKVNTLNSLSDQLWQAAEFNKSINYANDALKLAEKLNFKKGMAKAYYNQGYVYWNQGKYQQGLLSHFASLKIGEEIHDKHIIVAAYGNIGNIYYKQGNYSEAMKIYSLELQARGKMGDKQGMAYSYRHLANVFSAQGNYPEAVKNYLLSLKIDKELNNQLGICYTYCNIANVYTLQGNLEDALKNYTTSLDIAKNINNKQAIAVDYINVGDVYAKRGNYPEALSNKLAALKIAEEVGDKHTVAVAYNDIGLVYFKTGKYHEAIKSETASLSIAEEIGDKSIIASANICMGEIYTQSRKYDAAENYFNKSLSLAKEIGSKEQIKNTYADLARLDSITNNFKGAYQYHLLFTAMKDSLLNEESEKQIAQLKIQYETEEKNKEIEIKNIRIEKQKAAIKYLIISFILLSAFALIYFRLYNQKKRTTFNHQVLETEMKALRSQMNPHFTFNVLNSIQYYVGGNDMKSVELYLNKFSTLIRMILDQSRNAYITLEQEIKMLKLYLELEEMLFEKKFNYQIKVEKNINPEKLLIPGMLIQPIIENSIKHGIAHKKGGAMITIAISINRSALLCTVTDNGIGRTAAEKLRTDTSHKSVATDIIRERIEALSSLYNIRLSYKTEDMFNNGGEPEGTCVSMEIPFKNLELETVNI